MKTKPRQLFRSVAKIDPLVEADVIVDKLPGDELSAPQLAHGLRFGLECLVLHQIERFGVGHVPALHPDVQNRICDDAQANFQDH